MLKQQRDLQKEYEELKEGFTKKQVAFLEARLTANSDAEAADGVCAKITVPKWKKNPDFLKAYTYVTTLLRKDGPVLELTDDEREQLVKGQLDVLTEAVPIVVAEHLEIIRNASKESDRLKAIQMLYDVLGIKAPEDEDVEKITNPIHIQIMQLLAPIEVSEAERLSEAVPKQLRQIVEGQYREVFSIG